MITIYILQITKLLVIFFIQLTIKFYINLLDFTLKNNCVEDIGYLTKNNCFVCEVQQID